jgi:predicted ester cyclase
VAQQRIAGVHRCAVAARVIVDAARRRGAARVHRPRRALSGGQTGQQGLQRAGARGQCIGRAASARRHRRHQVGPEHDHPAVPVTREVEALDLPGAQQHPGARRGVDGAKVDLVPRAPARHAGEHVEVHPLRALEVLARGLAAQPRDGERLHRQRIGAAGLPAHLGDRRGFAGGHVRKLPRGVRPAQGGIFSAKHSADQRMSRTATEKTMSRFDTTTRFNHTARRTTLRTLAAATLLAASAAPTWAQQALTPEAARRVVTPFYEMLNRPATKDLAALANASLSPDWKSYSGEQTFKARADVLALFTGFGKLIPDLSWEIKEVLVAGDRVVVRGEARGTPQGPFFGVPPGGKSFNIMSIDVHTVRDGRIVASHHVEDWATAIRQLAGN